LDVNLEADDRLVLRSSCARDFERRRHKS
jgi:hypothetical protein